MHPLVAASTRKHAPSAFQAAIDTRLAAFWTSVFRGAVGDQQRGEVTTVAILAARTALPYLLRREDWNSARDLLEQALIRDSSPNSVTALLPAARYLAEATNGTDEHLQARRSLALLTRRIDPEVGLGESRQVLADAVTAGRYDVASLAAADVINACRATGRLRDALQVAQDLPEYSRRAGLGQWTQLLDERERLWILSSLGHYEQVLTDVDRLLAHADSLPRTSDQQEAADPWLVREGLLDTGRTAALGSGEWERALDYSDRIAASQRRRGAPAHEIAGTQFDTYYPLLRLERTNDALAVLRSCREAFESHGDLNALAKVLGALADAESKRGHGDAALALSRDALRLGYRAGNPADIAACHHNYGAYLSLYANDQAKATIHYLAAALVRTLTRDGRLESSVRALADKLSQHPTATPTTPTAVTHTVNQIDGVDLDRLLGTLASDTSTVQRAFDTVLTTARRLAAERPGPPSRPDATGG